MYPYSNTLKPDAPFVPIDIGSAQKPGKFFKSNALADTGASITAIPKNIVSDLKLQPIRHEPLGGFNTKDKKPIYVVNIKFHGLLFKNIPVTLFERYEFVLLGRDIINQFHMCFDGINQQTIVK